MLRVIDNKNIIYLSPNYDSASKFKIWQYLVSDFESFQLTRDTNSGRDSYADEIDNVISEFLDAGGSFSIRGKEATELKIMPGQVSSKTIYNFIGKSTDNISKIYHNTVIYIDAYIVIKNKKSPSQYSRDDFFMTLGASTSLQYDSVASQDDDLSINRFNKDFSLFSIQVSGTLIKTPNHSEYFLFFVRKIPDEEFLYVRVVPLPNDYKFSRFQSTDKDLSDWNEEQYSGIGIQTRDGISFHVTSMNAEFPAYIFVREGKEGSLECSISGFESPGYLIDYAPMILLNDINLFEYFENQPRLV